jgi:hypothetical protein
MSTSNISNIDIISLTDREIRQLSRSVTRVLDAHPGLPEVRILSNLSLEMQC